MSPERRAGRTVGGLLFLQLLGLMVPFMLLLPITTPDFPETAAAVTPRIRLAVLLLFALGLLTIGIAVTAFPLLRERGLGAALWLPAVSVLWLALQAVDNAHLMTMLSLSQRYTEAGASQAALLVEVGALARSSRVWAHYTELLVIETWFLVFYGLLLRSSLVPRPLAGFGLLMVGVHAAGITLPKFLGYDTMPSLGISLALSHVAVGSWLLAKGFGGTSDGAGSNLRHNGLA